MFFLNSQLATRNSQRFYYGMMTWGGRFSRTVLVPREEAQAWQRYSCSSPSGRIRRSLLRTGIARLQRGQ
jgi:hypothetical protein